MKQYLQHICHRWCISRFLLLATGFHLCLFLSSLPSSYDKSPFLHSCRSKIINVFNIYIYKNYEIRFPFYGGLLTHLKTIIKFDYIIFNTFNYKHTESISSWSIRSRRIFDTVAKALDTGSGRKRNHGNLLYIESYPGFEIIVCFSSCLSKVWSGPVSPKLRPLNYWMIKIY